MTEGANITFFTRVCFAAMTSPFLGFSAPAKRYADQVYVML